MGQVEGQTFIGSPNQDRLLRLGDRGGVRDIEAEIQITGPVDLRRLARALGRLTARHEILRTRVYREPPSDAVRQSVLALKDGRAEEAEERLADGVQLGWLQAVWAAISHDSGTLRLRLGPLNADLGSVRWLSEDLTALYGDAALEEDPVQYADVAPWLVDLADTEEGRTAARRGTAPRPVVRLPFEHPVEPGPSRDQIVFSITSEHLAQLRTFARTREMDIEAVLAAAWRALLSRTNGQDLAFGIALCGRGPPELRRAVGPYTTLAPVICRADDQVSFADLCVMTGLDLAELRAWRAYPWWPAGSDDAGCAIGFSFTDLTGVGSRAGAVVFQPVGVHGGEEASRLHLSCALLEETVACRLCFDPGVYETSHLQDVARQFCALLTDGLERPDCNVARLKLLDPSMAARAFGDAVGASPEPAPWSSVLDMLRLSVDRFADVPALLEGERAVTYQELDRLTDDLARRLVEAGARPDQPIGVLLPRSAEQVVALLAAIKSGGAPMPLDVNAPEPRVLGMLERARWPVLVAGRNAKPTLASYPGPILSAFTDEAPMALAETSTPAPSQLAYVIHTSGSTGTPKAVMVEHAALANRLEWAKKAYPLHPGDKLLYGANPAFDFALWEVFGCLISGACLVIPDAVVASDPGRLVSFMRDIGVSVAHFTPALLQLVAEESEFPRCDDLRLILSGGDVLPKETEQLVLDRSKAALYNQYGPTEGAIDVLSWRCRRDEGRWKPPLGRPIDGVATYLLDEEFEPVAIGLAGEIWVGGAAVARGYLSAPRETASRFRPDPYGGPGSRLYRTGDLARRRWDGALEFIGRRDSQVNVRGYRVELGEIEAAVRGHPEVDDCIASCVGDGFAGRLVLHWKGRASADSLRRWAGARLPDYMTPTSYVQVANFPLTPTGKIDRGALPSASRRLAFEAPATAVEAMLADLWCATFADHGVEIDALSVHDDFFELGGHSLLAIRLVNRIRSLTGLPVRIGAFFEALTVRDVAAVLVAEDPEGRLERAAEYWRDLPLPIGGDLEAGPGNTAKNGWTS